MDLKAICNMLWALYYAPGANQARASIGGVEILIEASGQPRVFMPIEGYGGGPVEVLDRGRVERIVMKLGPEIESQFNARPQQRDPAPEDAKPTDEDESAAVDAWLKK